VTLNYPMGETEI